MVLISALNVKWDTNQISSTIVAYYLVQEEEEEEGEAVHQGMGAGVSGLQGEFPLWLVYVTLESVGIPSQVLAMCVMKERYLQPVL